MFKNIIGYSILTSHLCELIHSNTLPSVFLFSGGQKAGKQTLSIELARVLLCKNQGKAGCTCVHCSHSYTLTHEHIVYVGNMHDMREIFCARDMLINFRTPREYHFFIRAVFKVLKRVDPFVWDHSDVWKRTLRSPSTALRELIMEYQNEEKNWYHKKTVNTIVQQVQKLYGAFPSQMLPVQCIKNIISWTMITAPSLPKIVIISNVEEMLPASANMLLKTLEEPPHNVFFILLSHNPLAILPTVRARTREYCLPPRSLSEEKEVLERVFKYTPSHQSSADIPLQSVREYLNSFVVPSYSKQETADKSTLSTLAQNFFEAVLRQNEFSETYIAFPTRTNVQSQSLSFLSYLQHQVQSWMQDSAVNVYLIKQFWTLIETARRDIQQKNINGSIILEMLYYSLIENYAVFFERSYTASHLHS